MLFFRLSSVYILIFLSQTQFALAYDYDVIVIGSGAGGCHAAISAVEQKMKVALVEKDGLLGGYVWRADTPSQALRSLSEQLRTIRCKHPAGIYDGSIVQYDTSCILPHIQSIIDQMSKIYSIEYFIYKGIDVISATAKIVDVHCVSLSSGKVITSEYIVIATGSVSHIPQLKGLASIAYDTAETFFKRKELPKSMIIYGNSTFAIEHAMVLNRLGISVILITEDAYLLPHFDPEVISRLTAILEAEGVRIQTNMNVDRFSTVEGGMIQAECTSYLSKSYTFKAESLFILDGREPNVQVVTPNLISLKMNAKGIIVNKHMQTNIPTIYACGDVTYDSHLLTRHAMHQGRKAIDHMVSPWWPTKNGISYKAVPKIVYSSPMVVSLGMTEPEARAVYGSSCKIQYNQYKYAVISIAENASEGFVKLIFDPEGLLIGAHIIGKDAGRLIDDLYVGKRLDDQLQKIFSCIYTSPSYLDVLWHALAEYNQNAPPKTWWQEIKQLVNVWI